MSTRPSLGLYLHIPFCVKKCAYCDFYSITDSSRMDAYTSALIRSIREYGEKSAGRTTDTVYLGGGTPSYLGGARLERILHAVRESFALAEDTEITVKDTFVITRINPFTKILNIQLNDIIFLLGTNHYTTVFFGITDSITQ